MDINPSLFFLLLAVSMATALPANNNNQDVANDFIHRVKRQDSISTTARARAAPKRRPTNIFRLLGTLLAETRDDTRRAFAEIGTLFNSQFSPNTPRPRPVSGPLSSSTTEITPSEGGNEGEMTTTTEPYRISRQEFNGILGSNFRGIIRLFGQELSNAISDSGRNVREFGREFRRQLRPLVEVRNGQQSS